MTSATSTPTAKTLTTVRIGQRSTLFTIKPDISRVIDQLYDVRLPRSIVLQCMTVLSSTGFTGCGKSPFSPELGAIRVMQNHHPKKISRPGSTVRDLFFALFVKRTFSAACSACVPSMSRNSNHTGLPVRQAG